MNELYNNYGEALLEIAKEENSVSEYREEIYSFYYALIENKKLIKLLSSYNISFEEKSNLINNLLKNKANQNFINYLIIIIKNKRGAVINKILKETLFMFDDYLHIERGTIYSTYELSSKEINKIKEGLETKLNKKLELVNKIDLSLIGGIKVVLKNDVYDGSIKSKIESLKFSLTRKD